MVCYEHCYNACVPKANLGQGVPTPSCDYTVPKLARTLLQETSRTKSHKLSCAAGQRYLQLTRRTSMRSETGTSTPTILMLAIIASHLSYSILIGTRSFQSDLGRLSGLIISTRKQRSYGTMTPRDLYLVHLTTTHQ